jgi:hypothetical protein
VEVTPSSRVFQWFTRKPLGSLVGPELPRCDRSDHCKILVGFVSGNCLVRVVLSPGVAGLFLACLVFLLCIVKGSSLQVVFWRWFFF